jgi:uroporphyrinogen-III synthase
MSAAVPLAGLRVVVTRAERQAGGLVAAFAAAGAAVETLPLLEVALPVDPAPLTRAAGELRLYDWVVFTSANAVHALLGPTRHLPASAQPATGSDRPGAIQPAAAGDSAPPAGSEKPAVAPAGSAGVRPAVATSFAGPAAAGAGSPAASLPPRLRVAAVGAATGAALRGLGVEPSLIAAAGEQSAGGLLAALLPHLDCGQRVLLPQAADALPTLREGLLAAGVAAVAVTAYEKRRPREAPRRAAELFGAVPIGWVSFSSPSIVRHFAGLFGTDWPRRRGELHAASIGPVTTAELHRTGVEPAAEAASPGDAALVAAVIAAVAGR